MLVTNYICTPSFTICRQLIVGTLFSRIVYLLNMVKTRASSLNFKLLIELLKQSFILYVFLIFYEH